MGSSKLVFLSSQYTDTVVEIQMAAVVFFHGSPRPLLEVRFGLVKAALPGAVATGNANYTLYSNFSDSRKKPSKLMEVRVAVRKWKSLHRLLTSKY